MKLGSKLLPQAGTNHTARGGRDGNCRSGAAGWVDTTLP